MSNTDDSKEQSLRYWGEERSDDAVYSVYLKKVRYHHPGGHGVESDSDDEISHLEWETVRVRLLKAGSLVRLVHTLACQSAGETDATYNSIFLSTFRAFTTPAVVLDLISQRYAQLDNDSELDLKTISEQKRSLRVALMLWLDSYSSDFDEPPDYVLLHRVIETCRKFLPETSELQFKAKHKLDKLTNEGSLSGRLQQISLNEVRADSGQVNRLTFSDIDERRFAEQLTRMDAELFRRVIPHQCLGSIWSRRRGVDASSVAATVDQFNAVSYCVISTVLLDTALPLHERAALLAKWMDIAQELRMLKNFSSLKAIISGLQSSSVYRLRHTWMSLCRNKLDLFEELARIFSDENNMSNQRQLLMKEGTAKYADVFSQQDKQLLKHKSARINQDRTVNHGTIPYLGTFLTDLMFVHVAIPDHTSDGLINFDKRRREFEILAQIRLLQGACGAYSFSTDAEFEGWFDSVVVLEDGEAHELSLQIQPAESGSNINGTGSINSSRSSRTDKHNSSGHRKNDSVASFSSGGSSSQLFCLELDNTSHSASNNADIASAQLIPQHDAIAVRHTMSTSSGGSAGSLEVTSAAAVSRASTSPYINAEFYIIRVSIRSGARETQGVNLYKSILLTNSERTSQVIRNAMLKHDVEGSDEDYILAQLLPDGEKPIPANCNVYYAINTAHDLNFVLLPKRDGAAGFEPDSHRPNSKPRRKKLFS